MSKDPAFLFYYQDWLVGTGMMTYRQKGAYIDILAHMADQGGTLELNQIRSILGRKFVNLWPQVQKKFVQNGSSFHNEKLSDVLAKRAKFCESRRKNRLSKVDKCKTSVKHVKTYDRHMGNENETENGNTLTPPPVNIDLPEVKGKDFLNGVQNI